MLKSEKMIRIGFIFFGTLLIFTGAFKFLEAYHLIGYIAVPQYWINVTHDASGVLIILLFLLNAAVKNIRVPAGWSSAIKEKKFLGFHVTSWLVAIAILAVGAAGVYSVQTFLQSRSIKQLAPSEVTEYQGKKLSPIADIQDNAINGTQHIDVGTYALNIYGLVDAPQAYTYDQVLHFQKYQKVVELDCVEGWKANILWEGVLVKDLLATARVKPQAKTVIFYASDGYTTSLPLDYIENNNILLAYKMNNVVIPPEKGFPFQLVAEQKWGYKWIKWITKIELSDDTNYQGTWEKAGYSNSADVSGPKMAK